jgi:diacylglycerol kinase family enzyme
MEVGPGHRMKFIVIINREAGAVARAAGEFSAEEVAREFASRGVQADVRMVAPVAVEPALRDAIAARPHAVVIGGGDGTVRGAAALLAGTGVSLGVFPLGTLNHFAKDLGVPSAWREAVAALAFGVVREVDVAEVNGHVFVNNCSLGAYAEAVRRRDALRRRRGHGKWLAMAKAVFAVFRRLRRLRLRIVVAGAERRVRTPLVVVANNRYSGHVLGPSLRDRLDEGRLWLYTAHVHRHLPVLRLVWQALTRSRPDAADALDAEAAVEITIAGETGRAVPVAADGELLDVKSPFVFRTRPRALRVLAPPPKPRAK